MLLYTTHSKETGKAKSDGLKIGVHGDEGKITFNEKSSLSITNYGDYGKFAAIKLKPDNSIHFIRDFETQMIISKDGNVGIGTSNPNHKLDVAGTVNATKYLLNGAQLNTSQWITSVNNIYFTTGNVGIGVSYPTYTLDVCGTIRAKEVRVNIAGCDFVFQDNYNLLTIGELEKYIQANKHLPDIAPAKEMETEQGVEIGEMQSKLLQKIEELSLYIIQQNKRIEQLEKKIAEKK